MNRRWLSPLALVLAVGVTLAFPNATANGIAAVTAWLVERAGPAVLWLGTASLLLMLVLALGPWGRRRLPRDPSEPPLGTAAWLAMLFAAGMGSGLVFWGLAEPLSHFHQPPSAAYADPSAALALTYLHWGFHAWAIYAVAGLAFALLGDRRPGLSLLNALWSGDRPPADPTPGTRRLAGVIDWVALAAVLFGVAGSLANGVDLIRVGLSAQTTTTWPGWLLLAALAAVSLVSASTGLRGGIRVLSFVNLALAAGVALRVWWVGEGGRLATLWWDSLVLYLKSLPTWSVQLISNQGDLNWARGWTVVYLLWWVAWTPFVGLFLAGISRGRSLRAFALAVVLMPTLVSMAWFVCMGGNGLLVEQDAPGSLTGTLSEHYTAPLFAWYDGLPGGVWLAWGSLLLLFLFLVTSADSAAWVMGRLSRLKIPVWVFSLALGLVALPLVIRGDVDVNKQVAIAGAIPFCLVLGAQLVALLRVLPGGAGRDAD
ncbi:MAG: BCCT family transporter [Pseudomonadota bacterium]